MNLKSTKCVCGLNVISSSSFVVLAGLVLVLFLSGPTQAALYTLTPNPSDLYDLDHHRYYTWGIDRPWDSSDIAVSATLSFDNIRNWNDKPNVLYIHLLDRARLGVRQGWDNQGGGDQFAGQGVVLEIYRNLPSTPQDLSYSFTPEQILALNAYASDGRFGLGFDPDCHFYNDGAQLNIATGTVPEPASIALLTMGLGIFGGRRKK